MDATIIPQCTSQQALLHVPDSLLLQANPTEQTSCETLFSCVFLSFGSFVYLYLN